MKFKVSLIKLLVVLGLSMGIFVAIPAVAYADGNATLEEDKLAAGTVGEPINTSFTLKLDGDTFNGTSFSGTAIEPAGLSYSVTATDGEPTATITFSGTLASPFSGPIMISDIPYSALTTGSGSLVDATFYPNLYAQFHISGSATIDSNTVNGTVGKEITPVEFTVTLVGDTFCAIDETVPDSSVNGLSFRITAIDGSSTAKILFFGTPTTASTAEISFVSLPDFVLTSGVYIFITNNPDARYNIVEESTSPANNEGGLPDSEGEVLGNEDGITDSGVVLAKTDDSALLHGITVLAILTGADMLIARRRLTTG